MKKISVLIILSLLMVFNLLAIQPVSLAWNPSPDSNVVAYAVYFGPASNDFTDEILVGNVTNVTLYPPDGQTNYYAVVAVNASGLQSPFSNQIFYLTPNFLKILQEPSDYAISFSVSSNHIYTLQSTTNIQTLWVPIYTTPVQLSNQWVNYTDYTVFPQNYYRLVVTKP